MYLLNFSIQEDIKLKVTGRTLDLHNCFDLKKYTYNIGG